MIQQYAVKQLLEDRIIHAIPHHIDQQYLIIIKWRFKTLCRDYRNLKDETDLEPFPFPRIHKIIDGVGDCSFFTPEGHYELFTHVPFGCKNLPAIFQRYRTRALANFHDLRVVMCCQAGYTLEEYADLTENVLQRLNKHNVSAIVKKCEICCVPKVNFLKRIIDDTPTKQVKLSLIDKIRKMKNLRICNRLSVFQV